MGGFLLRERTREGEKLIPAQSGSDAAFGRRGGRVGRHLQPCGRGGKKGKGTPDCPCLKVAWSPVSDGE